MGDRYIILDYAPRKHVTLEEAQAERSRLIATNPAKTYRVWRVKTHLSPGKFYPRFLSVLRELAAVRVYGGVVGGDPEIDSAKLAQIKVRAQEVVAAADADRTLRAAQEAARETREDPPS